MPADIALGQRAIDRVAQRVDADIGVGMACEALVVRDGHAAQDHRPVIGQHVDVEAGADMGKQRGRHGGLQPAEIVGLGEFDVAFGSRNDRHRLPQRLQQGGVVGRSADAGQMGGEQCLEAERLRSLRAEQPFARHSFLDDPVFGAFQRVADRRGGNGAGRMRQSGQQCRDSAGRNQWPRGVMHQNELGA